MHAEIIELLEQELVRLQDAAENLAQQVAHMSRLLELAKMARTQPTLPALGDADAPK
jgi:hypothetical protein